MAVRIIQGHVLDRLRELPDESVHCVVTSPPYYGLRSYGTEPQVWGGDPTCEHVWHESERSFEQGNKRKPSDDGIAGRNRAGDKAVPVRIIASEGFCHCGAWRGDLGLEPTPSLYLKHMVEVFREVRRVLRKDGTCWVNMGDSYHNLRTHKEGGQPPQSFYKDKQGQPKRHGQPEVRGANRMASIAGLKEKDLMGMPWRLAFALQDDGWWLRSEITWCKRAPMPESVTDRPTSATEKIFVLAKSQKYFWDAIAVQEDAESDHPSGNGYKRESRLTYTDKNGPRGNDQQWDGVGFKRNMRNFWLLGPEPFPEAHFATFVTEIPRRAILAGTSAKGVCPACGAPWVRQTKSSFHQTQCGTKGSHQKGLDQSNGWSETPRGINQTETIGWRASCGCDVFPLVPGTVLDPFGGSGTTGLVADRLGRNAILIELNPEYAAMAERRLREDAGMFSDIAAD